MLSEKLERFSPVGFFTAEVREAGVRKGFELISLDGKRGLLSHQEINSPYRVGSYQVDVRSFEDFLDAIPWNHPQAQVVIIDEIGKMECLSDPFKKIVKEVLDSEKWLIATIAIKGSGLIAEIKKRKDIRLFTLTQKNRDQLGMDILREMNALLS